MRLSDWFKTMAFWRKADAPRKITPVRPIRHEMTLERWHADDGLVNWAKQSAEFAYVLSVISSCQPTGFPIRGQAVTDTQCNVELGRKEGYADCYALLLSLRQFPKAATEEIEANYDDTEYPELSKR
jgi:hypothetical protein